MIDFRNVSIHFGTQDVLKEASFRINRGERCGVVGPNGAGKSTIFHLITGEMSPEHGDVFLEGKPRIGHLHQQLKPHPVDDTLLSYTVRAEPKLEELETEIHDIERKLAEDTSIIDDVSRQRLLRRLGVCQSEFEHLGGYDVETRVKTALSGLGFRDSDFQRPFSDFSGGWRMRAELARSLVMHPDLLLLDEPSNYLDLPAVEWIQKFLRDYSGTMMLISHDRYLLRSLTDVTLEVDGCTATRYNGGLDFYLKEREQRYITLLAAKKNQDRMIEQTQRFIDTFRYTPTKSAQVQSKIKMLEKLERVVVPKQASSAGHIRLPDPEPCGTCALRLKDVGFSYDNGENFVFRNVSFEVARGERVAIVGYNGMGKTTLSRLLAGIRQPTEGEVVFGHKVVPGYVSQDFREVIPDDQSLIRAVRLAGPALSESEARSLLGSFGFSGDDVFKTAGVLSGGEKIRLAFARMFAAWPNVLILDEPTTHLDLNGRRALENELRAYKGTIVVVSHDVEFVRAVSTSVLAFEQGGLIHKFSGGYDDYRSALARGQVSNVGVDTKPNAPPNKPDKDDREITKSKKELRKERASERAKSAPRINDLKRRIAAAESRIDVLEKEQAELVTQMQSCSEGIDFASLNKRLAEITRDLNTLNSIWEQSAAELEFLTTPSDL